MTSTRTESPGSPRTADSLPLAPQSPDAVVFRLDGEPRSPEAMIGLIQRYQAEYGYEVDDFSRGGTVEKLERRFAEVLGKESAIFMPTGTLANHLAIRRHCGTRPRAIVQEQSHLYNDTGDSVAQLSGINLVPLGTGRPGFTLAELEEVLQRSETGRVANAVGVMMIESPVRRHAGQVVPYDDMKAMTSLCRERGVPTHLDGARLFMMSAATGIGPAEHSALFDTVYVSLYKYLGAPFGAILAGSAEFADGLYHDRRMFGSGLQSSALVAGMALMGLDGFEERFAAAMARTQDLFSKLNALPGLAVEPFDHGSNIFPMRLAPDIDPDRLAAELAERSVFIYPRTEQYEGRTLLHVNTSILRQPNDRVFRAFEEALQRAGEHAKVSD